MEIGKARTREDAIDILNGASARTTEDLQRQVNRRPLVKTYMFEHGGGREFLTRNFQRAKIVLEQIDSFFLRSETPERRTISDSWSCSATGTQSSIPLRRPQRWTAG